MRRKNFFSRIRQMIAVGLTVVLAALGPTAGALADEINANEIYETDENAAEEIGETDENAAEEEIGETDEIVADEEAGGIDEITETEINITEESIVNEIEEETVGTALNTKVNAVYQRADNVSSERSVDECFYIEGSNINLNDYSKSRYDYKASVNYSNIVYLSDGSVMRFQGNGGTDGYYVQYFDSDFNLIKNKTRRIPVELPVFGGFFSDENYYYILSGQNNPDKDENVEVFRVTRYDKNWNRYSGVASLKGANTTIPFRSGSARFAKYGTMLYIRTSHQMYGGHQASVSMKIDTANMSVLQAQYEVASMSMGYISHSFNQFVRIDNGYVVTVDHGDANERGINLVKYDSVDSLNGARGYVIPEFAGNHGENWTGATVGGFEVTSTNYLIAYSLNNQANYSNSMTRNIYIASVNKTAMTQNPVQIKKQHTDGNYYWFGQMETNFDIDYIQYTDFADGEETARNPYLIKLESDSLLLMWARGAYVYYCNIDGEGKPVGNIYYMSGELSDCEPQKMGSKIVWYVYNNEKLTFNTIDYTNLSKTETKIWNFGHSYRYTDNNDGTLSRECQNCGDKNELTTLTDFELVYSNDENYYSGYNYYNSGSTLNLDCSKPLHFLFYSVTPSDAQNKDFYFSSDNEGIIKGFVLRGSNIYSAVVGTESGTAVITIGVKNSLLKKTVNVNVTHNYAVTDTKPATGSTPAIQVETCSGCGAVRETELAPKNAELLGGIAKLTNMISLDLYFDNIPKNSSVVVDGPSGKVTVPSDSMTVDQYGRYIATYEVLPQYMRSANSVYIVDEQGCTLDFTYDGRTVSSGSWKLIDYFNAIYSDAAKSQAEKNLAKALIEYCDNTAYYFNPDLVANGVIYTKYSEIISDDNLGKKIYSAPGTMYSGIEGVEYLGTSLIMVGVPGMRHYFRGNLDGCVVTISGVAVKLIECGNNLYYCEDLYGCLLSSMDSKREIVISKDSTDEKWKMDYSVLSYCLDGSSLGNDVLKNLCISIYNVYAAEKNMTIK